MKSFPSKHTFLTWSQIGLAILTGFRKESNYGGFLLLLREEICYILSKELPDINKRLRARTECLLQYLSYFSSASLHFLLSLLPLSSRHCFIHSPCRFLAGSIRLKIMKELIFTTIF